MRNKSPKAISKTTRKTHLHKTSYLTHFKWVLGLSMPLLLTSPRALSLEINYAGRLTEATGKPIEGPLDFSVRFYQSESSGDTVGPTLTLSGIELRDGVFQLSLNLDSSQMATVFGDGSKTVYVEVEAGGKVYPRQRFVAAPMALRVPVDSSQLAYNNDGKLSISQIELSRVSGLTAALAAKADSSAVTSGNLKASNNLSDLTSPAAARTNLGLGPMATASALNDSDISATAAIAQSKIAGLATSLSGKEPAIAAGTTAQYLRGDKSWTDFNTTARSAVSITAPLTYNSGTGVFGLGQASGVADGFLTSSDFTAFNAKQAAISAATTVNAGTVTTALQNGVQIKPYGVAAGNSGELRFDELVANGTNYVGFKAPDTLTANRIWTLPPADGTGGQLLTTDGSGNLSWVNTGGTGTVTSVNLTQPSEGITVSGGPITGSGSITLALSNDLAAVEGLSTLGGVERTAANTWSTYTLTAAGKALIDDSDATAQRTTLGLGALSTAAAVSGGTAGTITDDTITDADINSTAAIAQSKISGLTTSLSGKEPTITAGTTAQFYRGDKAWTDFNTTARGAVSITAPLTYNSGTGVFGLGQASGVADGYLSSSDFTVFNTKQAAISAATTVNAGTVTTALQNGVQIKPYGVAAGNSGELRFDELVANGTNYVGFKAPDALAGDRIWTLPIADGTNGQVLRTDGSGVLDWVSPNSGSVTSVNLTAPAAGITVSGGPITSSGSITLALGDDLAAVEGISTTGGVERTAANTWSTYTLTAAGKALIDDADATAQRTTLGLGALSTAATVSGGTAGTISDDTITDADINSAAAIAQSKISGLTTDLAAKEPTITAGTTAQFYRGDKSWTDFNTTVRGAVGITAPLTYNSGTGVFGLGQASGVADGYLSQTDFVTFNNKQAAISAATTVNAGTVTTALQNGVEVKPYGAAAGNAGELRFDELAANGTNYVGFKAPDTLAGNRIWTLPIADGTNGQVLATNGTGTLSWATGAAGSVTSVGLTQPSEGITVSGGPITSSGSMTLALANDLAAVEALTTTGGVERTAANTWSTYTLSAAGKALIDDADATAQRTTLGLGSLATLSAVGSSEITDDSIMNVDINSAAAIADTKLATISTAGKVSGSAITSGTIAGSTILNTTGAITTSSSITGLGVNGTTFMAGTGDAGPSPVGGTVRAASGAGTDIAGSNLTVTSGNGTGTGGSGSILFQTAPTAGTSATANTMATRMAITPSGNVGIGTTTPSRKLHIVDSVTAVARMERSNNTGWATSDYVPQGVLSSSNPSFYTGLEGSSTSYSIGSHDGTIDTTRLVVTSAGNVGIGTTSPAYTLDVNGTVRATSFIGTGNSDWNNQNINNLSSLGIGTTSPAGNLSFGGAAARTLQVDRHTTANTAGSDLTVTSGGATSGATDKNGGSLVLSSGTATGSGSSKIEFKTSTPGSAGTADSAPTTKMVISGDGNVGIGSTSPQFPLDVKSNSIATVAHFGTNHGISLIDDWPGIGFNLYHNSGWKYGPGSSSEYGALIEVGASSGDISFYTTNAAGNANAPASLGTRMTITGSGNVGIGSTSPAHKLDVNGNINSSSISTGYMNVATPGNTSWLVIGNGTGHTQGTFSTSADTGGYFSIQGVQSAGSTYGNLALNSNGGNVGIGTTSPVEKLNVSQGNIQIDVPVASTSFIDFRETGFNERFGIAVDTGGSGSMHFTSSAAGAAPSSATAKMTLLPSGNVGIGTTNPTRLLDVTRTDTTTTGADLNLANFAHMVVPSANQAANAKRRAVVGWTEVPSGSTNSVKRIEGVYGGVGNSGSGSVDRMTGVTGFGYQWGSSTIDSVIGGELSGEVDAGTVTNLYGAVTWTGVGGGSVTNQYGFAAYLDKWGGTVTNRYGVYLNTPSGTATNDYGIYQAGTQKNYFAGNIGIGTTNPTTALQVTGAIVSTTGTTLTPSGTAQTVDFASSNSQTIDLSSATGTVTLTFSGAVNGGTYTVVLVQGGTPRSVVWPAAVKWEGGIPVVLSGASASDVITMFYNGTNYFAVASKNFL